MSGGGNKAAGTASAVAGAGPSRAEVEQVVGLFGQARYAEVEPLARALTQRYARHGFGWKVLGAVLKQSGRDEEALGPMQTAAALLPKDFEAHYNLGNMLRRLGRLVEAEASYRRVVTLKPDFAEGFNNLGATCQDIGMLQEAEASLRRALELDPKLSEACCNLGNVLAERGALLEAEQSYRRAMELKPDYAEAHYNLAGVLRDQGRCVEAIHSYQNAITLKSDRAEAWSNMGCVLQQQGQSEEAEASCRRALALKPDFVEAWSNLLFVLNYDPDRSAEKIYEAHREYDARFGVPLRASWPAHGNSRELGRRLKVGYVSPDFRKHAVSAFLEPLLARHDKSVVEVVAYAEVKREDAVSTRCKGYVDHWVRTVGLSDEALAERIGADGIDILVDLAGHTAGNRLQVFARKPAPVQVTWLGYPGSSGLSAMDYRLSDGCADPQGSEAYYTERLLRLPDCLCCYRPGQDMPEVTALPAQRNGYVTFGSFNNFNKINSQCIELWARLLRAVPQARLLMLTIPEGEPRQGLAEQFAALGVSAERLEFQGRFSGGEFYRMMQRADIALDPFPVTGGTTTCETLWMGVPVIVLVGKRYISRVGYSFLSAAGMPQYAAATPQAYIDIATQLARDLPRLAEIRAGMRPKMAASPLVDEAGFARKVEAAYREMFGRWASGASRQ